MAPRYDFRTLPPPNAVLYDANQWEITGERWCLHAQAALTDLDMFERS